LTHGGARAGAEIEGMVWGRGERGKRWRREGGGRKPCCSRGGSEARTPNGGGGGNVLAVIAGDGAAQVRGPRPGIPVRVRP